MKTCFKCGAPKPIKDFYKHPMMSDGRIGKCKECTKLDAKKYRVGNRRKISRYERRRNKNPERRKKRLERIARYRKRYPERYKANMAVNNAVRDRKLKKLPCQFDGCGKKKVEAHHPDYSKPLEVIWYCKYHHQLVEGKVAVV